MTASSINITFKSVVVHAQLVYAAISVTADRCDAKNYNPEEYHTSCPYTLKRIVNELEYVLIYVYRVADC